MKIICLCVLLISIGVISGCSEPPDKVITIESPKENIFYSVETYYGHGAIDNDYTRVYANLKHNGKLERIVVLGGEYLTFANISWDSPHEITLCLVSGITDTYRNEVTLISGDVSIKLDNHLVDNCKASDTGIPEQFKR